MSGCRATARCSRHPDTPTPRKSPQRPTKKKFSNFLKNHPPIKSPSASNPRLRRLQRWALLAYGALLLLTSLLPSNRLPRIPDWSDLFSPDKVAHFLAYGIFALLLSLDFRARYGKRAALYAILFAAAFGALIEVLQGVMNLGREMDAVDMVANSLGALLGGGLFALLTKLYNTASP